MNYVVKTAIPDPLEQTATFTAQKTMYGGKHIAPGDTAYLFASEHEGGRGLVARGIVTAATPVPVVPGGTPRVTVTIRRTALPRRPLGRADLRPLSNWKDGQPGTELNFKFYRQATSKIGGISDAAADFLETFFR